MYRIGEFSCVSKTTIKTLRYYEKEGLLVPSYVDSETNYRFYETTQLVDLSKIIALRQIGMSIDNIKEILKGKNVNNLLLARKEEVENELNVANDQLSRLNYLLKGEFMKYEVIVKELPAYTIYYKEGIVKSFNDIPSFILTSADECREINSDIKCIEPDYCYVSYLDHEYKENDIRIMYAQAVTKAGNESDAIKFKNLETIKAACIYHKGSYSTIRDTYSIVLKWIGENGYEIAEPIRERYIDGMWNKESVEDWLTEVEVPIIKKD